jgi:tetratricopeptide (TPR) repeat protein
MEIIEHLKSSKSKWYFCLLYGLILFAFGCDTIAEKNAAVENKNNETARILDKPLAAFQNELLEIAFKTATAIPVKPHIKDRSRAQEAVVDVCLKLDQPRKATGYVEKIDNWRRGSCYADLALYYAKSGDANEVSKYLNLANKIAEEDVNDSKNSQENSQYWRRDHINVKIAQTHLLLGQTKLADDLETGLEENSEKGKIAGTKAVISSESSFEEQVKALDGLIELGNFDITKNSLEAYTQLFNRFYADPNKCLLTEEKIKKSWDKMPIFIRVELLMKLAGFAIDNSDKKKTLELVNEAQAVMDSSQWPLESHIPMIANLTALRYKAGDVEKAKNDSDKALAMFNEQKNSIVNIYRAKAICPLAESYQLMGDAQKALTVYKIAIEEGVENPNSRPRAEDLSATCSSMALAAIEPDAQLWARIHQIYERLGNPW